MSKPEYVLILAQHWIRDWNYVYVEKDRPAAQIGRINLPGGKIEPGETPEQAVVREFKEECGFDINTTERDKPDLMGIMTGDWGKIYCFKTMINCHDHDIQPRSGETELFFWESIAFSCEDPRCMPNLKVIVPLMYNQVRGWTVTDNNPSLDHRPYSIQIDLG